MKHEAIDAKAHEWLVDEDKHTREITVEPDQHGMTLRFEGSDKRLIIELRQDVFLVHYFEDHYKELLCMIVRNNGVYDR